MIINKLSDSKTTEIITEEYLKYIKNGAKPSEILVLCFNSNSKKLTEQSILKSIPSEILEDFKIYTFYSLVYNTIKENWCELENLLDTKTCTISPNLIGLEVSQLLLKQIIKSQAVKGYNSQKSLLHQIFRRYSLIVNNHLSQTEIQHKSEILKEAFGVDANNIINSFKSKTIDLRSFDYIRQAQIFSYIFKKTEYFKNIKYLIAEDADEMTPLMIDFIKALSPHLEDKLIIFDRYGASRCGYLCADLDAPQKLEKIFNETAIDFEKNETFDWIRQNVFSEKKSPIDNISCFSYSKRLDMIEEVTKNVLNLLKKNKPSDITIVTPIQDRMLRCQLQEGLNNYKLRFLSGNEKLTQNPLVKSVLFILKLGQNKTIDEYELRMVLSNYIGIPINHCKEILLKYRVSNRLEECDAGTYTQRYNKFRQTVSKLQCSEKPLSEKALYIYNILGEKVNKTDLSKLSFFIKELQDFEKTFKTDYINQTDEILVQAENTIISENPYLSAQIAPDELVIATPQKIIDNKICSKYQFWLDVSSEQWQRTDSGPLYNSWVFQKNWVKDEYTIEDNIEYSKEKISRVLRKLYLNAKNIYAYSSLFDTQGVENIGGIEQYLVQNENDALQAKPTNKITPRDDQKPVLKYKSGRMAISAVPGAGKTTILLALVIKLLELKIKPENIYVMTYMESAARNFKERIKSLYPTCAKLPNISTIHGLALRIIKENSNYERIGLNSDFEICDDIQRARIIRAISKSFPKENIDDFDKAISVLKLSGAKLDLKQNKAIRAILNKKTVAKPQLKLYNFLKFFYTYQKTLLKLGLIDYDDILISAVRLLERNGDILKHYQEICEYMIEDEAQDSSFIQQRLINLLCAKHNNLIRCGDINQAITATFTNADITGFKEFISNSNEVSMNCSQRCSKKIMELANRVIDMGEKLAPNTFYKIYMNPVEGKNPVEKTPLISNVYENETCEKQEIIRVIKNILKTKPQSTIGILLRNNYQVNSWAQFVNDSGLSAITRNECLAQKNIFKVIFSVLQLVSEPFSRTAIKQAYKSMAEVGIFKPQSVNKLEKYGDDFITIDNDEIEDGELSKFHWDMNYWLSFCDLSIDELALKIGLNYFSQSIEKSNIFLISTLIAKINNGNFKQTLKNLEDLSKRPTLSGFKFFAPEDENEINYGKVQIMTLHKSKGDEFDYVFLPEMSEKNLTLDIDKLSLKKSSEFMEDVRSLNENYKKKDKTEQKQDIISENFRLLYVAITRAKRRLYVSVSKKEKYYGKVKEITQNKIVNELLV